jgi:hypothetical protein
MKTKEGLTVLDPQEETIEEAIADLHQVGRLYGEMHKLQNEFPELDFGVARKGNWFSRNKHDIGMIGIGLGAGLAAAVGVWFYEKRKRKQMLEQITFAIKAAKTLLEAPDTKSILSANGKDVEIKAADYLIQHSPDLQRVIAEQMLKSLLGKKEHTEWLHALRALGQLAQLVQAKLRVAGDTSASL